MAEITSLSTTDASNTARFPEGMAPSAVNDAARALEGMLGRAFKDTIDGALTTAGTSTAYTCTLNRQESAWYTGLQFTVKWHTASGATPTINPTGSGALGAKSLYWPSGTQVTTNDLPSGAVSKLYYDGTNVQVLTTTARVGAASDTAAGIVELATDAETATGTDTARAVTPANVKSAYHKQGLQTVWIPATAMYGRTTNGAASGAVETSTNKVMRKSLDFDTSTQEFAQFVIRFPKNYNLSTVTFAPYWTAASGSGGVTWGLAGVALSDDDASDTAFGTAQTSADTLITAGDIHVGPTSSAITIAGTPAAADWIAFQVNRTVADANDTLGVDACLLGIALFFTTNAADDT
jgi:hypothetical protein